MPALSRAAHGLAALILSCLLATPSHAGFRIDADPGWARAQDLDALVAELEAWLDKSAPWARRPMPPEVVVAGADEATTLAGQSERGMGRVRGLYSAETATIYLVAPWSAGDADDVSVLLHELVHHRQAPHHFVCPGAQELPAYRLQQAWLNERGLELKVSWIAVVLASGCGPKDMHPD